MNGSMKPLIVLSKRHFMTCHFHLTLACGGSSRQSHPLGEFSSRIFLYTLFKWLLASSDVSSHPNIHCVFFIWIKVYYIRRMENYYPYQALMDCSLSSIWDESFLHFTIHSLHRVMSMPAHFISLIPFKDDSYLYYLISLIPSTPPWNH
jgi:hypothetical protein